MRHEAMRVSRSGLAVTLAAVVVALQLVRPDLARAPARTELAAPPAVRGVDHRPTYGYEEYRGTPFQKVAEREPGADRPARLDAILGRRALVMP